MAQGTTLDTWILNNMGISVIYAQSYIARSRHLENENEILNEMFVSLLTETVSDFHSHQEIRYVDDMGLAERQANSII